MKKTIGLLLSAIVCFMLCNLTVSAAEIWRFPLDTYKYIGCKYNCSESHHSSPPHKGLDIPANEGTPIKATQSGWVVRATYGSSEGNYVMLRHDNGLYSAYKHMSYYIVKVDEWVTQGQVIGYVGNTGYSSGPHLHFEMGTGAYYSTTIDPLNNPYAIIDPKNPYGITEAPSKSIIFIEKTEYAVDEIVDFKFDTDGTKGCNVLWIYCPDGSTLYYTDLYDTYSLGFGMSGNFEALVQAWNSIGAKSSERIKFHIGSPTYANIQLSKSEFDVNETITFYLDTDATPNCNCVWIYYPDGSTRAYTNLGPYLEIKLDTPGTYEAIVQAWNSIGAKSSNRIKFYVNNPKPHTSSVVTKSGTKLIVDTQLNNIVAPFDLLIVGYKHNKFVTMKKVPYNEQNSPYFLVGDIDEIKVMVWSDLSTLAPLCEAEEIPSSKWITE